MPYNNLKLKRRQECALTSKIGALYYSLRETRGPARTPAATLKIGELKALSQRNITVEKRARRIQLGLNQNDKDLDARAPRSTVHAEMKSYGIEGRYIALVVGRFGEFSRGFVKVRDFIARQKAYAYNEHFNSSVNMAMSMFKLSITPVGR